jgi:hypothetical protein
MSEQATTEPRGLDPSFLRDFSARWHAAWNSHDHREVELLCTEDVELVDPSLAEPGRGAEALAAVMEKLVRVCPDFHFEESEPAYACPTRPKAIAPFRFTGTMTGPLVPPGFAPTGQVLRFHGDDHWDFRGELVCRTEAIYDLNGVGVQLGAVPPPGSAGERLAVMLQKAKARRLRRTAAR